MAFALVRFARTSVGLSSLEYAVVVAVSAGLALLGDETRGAIESIAGRVSGIAAPNGG